VRRLPKSSVGAVKSDAELDLAVRQIVSKAIAAEGVVDLFAAIGVQKPNLAILSDEFLDEMHRLPQRHLAAEFCASCSTTR